MLDRWSELFADSFQTRPGVDGDALDAVEVALGVNVPPSLRELYLHSDGLYSSDGYPWIRPVGDLIDENRTLRATQSFDASLIAIGGDGAGDVFCVRSSAASLIYCWYPIDGELRQLAPDLETLLVGWRDGTITT